MQILALVTDAFGGHGGIAKFNRDLLAALCGQADITQVVAIPRLIPEPPGTLPPKLEYVTSGTGGKFRYALAVLKAAIRGQKSEVGGPRSAVRNQKSEIILCGHINLLPIAFLVRWLRHPLTSDLRPPIVLVIHGVDAWQPTRSWLVNRLARRVDAVIAVSEFTRQRFWAWAAPARARHFILPNCVDLERFTPGAKDPALLQRYGLAGQTVLLTVARLSAAERYKGHDQILELLPELAREIPDLAYLIVGDGTDRLRLEAKVAHLGLQGRVKFVGWISDAEMVEHYRLADAFVMPGRGEGFGIVYLEALACGVPVVASKADASAEVVRGCDRALVADPGQPEEIKSAIRAALQIQTGPRPAAVEKYTQEKFHERCGAIFRALREPRSVLVFRIGQLGDTVIALPAMWALRRHFLDARLTLLCDRHPGQRFVLAADLLRGTGIFDGLESYVVDDSARGKWLRPLRMAGLAWRLRRHRYDTLVYLAPSTRTAEQVARDRKFFALAGLKNFIGMQGFAELPRKISGQPLAATPPESDLILARLAADGIAVPAAGHGSLDLGLGDTDEAEVAAWLRQIPDAGGRLWLGIGPGSKMPAKRWPEDRFCEVVAGLIAKSDVWPVVFGGPEDAAMAARLLAAWGRGHNAAGALSLRGATAALQRCALYLGNDTGTMHLAAAAGVPCVAVFSSREWPGMWYPYGVPQQVFRTPIECEGCTLVECVERKNECLNRIQSTEVLAACEQMLLQGKSRNQKSKI